jgi:hypothetical protein
MMIRKIWEEEEPNGRRRGPREIERTSSDEVKEDHLLDHREGNHLTKDREAMTGKKMTTTRRTHHLGCDPVTFHHGTPQCRHLFR